MRKGSDLIGQAVVTYDTGVRIYRIRDLLFDQNSNKLLGFLLEEGRWFSAARVLPFESVKAIGPDAVLVESRNAVVGADQVPEILRIVKGDNVLKGTKIMTTDGRYLGTMVDLFFDEGTGAVEGYEVSGGLFADAYSGRSFVPAPKTHKIGYQVAFVPPEVADEMEQQVGGVRGGLQSADVALQGASDRFTSRVRDSSQRAGERFSTGIQSADQNMDEFSRAAVARRTVEQARGRVAEKTVEADDGQIVVAEGQTVGEMEVERAREFHKEHELLDAVGLDYNQVMRSVASGWLVNMDRRFAQGSATTEDRLAELWERFRARASELQERSGRGMERQRINRALGRPVTRVILDRDDDVILNVGELITHRAVALAREAGVLGILLDSVYDKEPELSTNDLRAPQPGEASLDSREGRQDRRAVG